MHWNIKAWSELTASDLYAVMAARQEVFVVEQACAYLDADGADPEALHLWTCDDPGHLLAYLRVFGPGVRGVEARLGRVLTTRIARGKGLGRPLVRRGIQVVQERFGACPIRIAAQKHLDRFYAEFGFVAEGVEYLEDDIPHIDMVRAAD